MKKIATLIGALIVLLPSSLANAKQDPVNAVLEKLGTEAIRMADSDLCLPSNADEYEALGKNGVLRIEASSAISSELPITSAYLEIKGLQFPLTKIVAFEKYEDQAPATSKAFDIGIRSRSIASLSISSNRAPGWRSTSEGRAGDLVLRLSNRRPIAQLLSA